MNASKNVDRRRFLAVSARCIAAVPMVALAKAEEPLNPDEGVTAPEDLMKEHGVLNRCLLIYEEAMRRLEKRSEVSPEVFGHMAQPVKQFAEDYHERNDEKY